MKPLRKFLCVLAACTAASAFVPQAVAAGLADDPFIRDNINRTNFEPGGKYHLFGSRGTVAERTGSIGLQNAISNQMGNLLIERAEIKGDPGFVVRFGNHGHEVHSPFDNHASRSASDEAGSPVDGFTLYRLDWSGHEHHPADGYDGPQGGGYPAPKGARDIYTYEVNGVAQRIKLTLNDNRSTEQRLFDRFNNIPQNFAGRAEEAHKKIFEHDPNLNFWGNKAQIINGVFAAAANGFQSAGEAIGVGDAVQGLGAARDIAAMHGIGQLSTANKINAVEALSGAAKFENHATETVRDWAAKHPNTLEAAKAVGNAATVGVGAAVKGAGIAKSGNRNKSSGVNQNSTANNQTGRYSTVDGEMAGANKPVKYNTSEGKADSLSGRNLADQLTARMSKPIVKDPTLKKITDDLYRENARIGSGSTADAVRYELKYNTRVGGREHSEKAKNYSVALERWIAKNPDASFSDQSTAKNIWRDLQNALKGE